MELPDPWTHPLLSLSEAAQCLGIGRATAYRMAAQLGLVTVDLGGRKRVSTRWVYETVGEPLPPRPGMVRGFTLADLDRAAATPPPGPPW